MATPVTAASFFKKLIYHSQFAISAPPPPSQLLLLRRLKPTIYSSLRRCLQVTDYSTTTTTTTTTTTRNTSKKKKKIYNQKSTIRNKIKNNTSRTTRLAEESVVKRRTRSEKEFDEEAVLRFGDGGTHIPVMLGEVLDVFASRHLRSFVDCTLGAGGHSSALNWVIGDADGSLLSQNRDIGSLVIRPRSSRRSHNNSHMPSAMTLYSASALDRGTTDWFLLRQIIQAHSEMQLYVGMDMDPAAHEKSQARMNQILHCDANSILKSHFRMDNFQNIETVLSDVDFNQVTGVDGIFMDLGMSSMQVDDAKRGFSVLKNGPLDMRMNPKDSLKAEDILNSWQDAEVGRILREYGEESNWHTLQNKIVKARLSGGLHSTGQLVELIRSSSFQAKGRQGWIKTATRVFQALRIAVNDELKTLEESLYACFRCLAPGGRLAVISFHSLEDRIVKQTFLNIINNNVCNGNGNKSKEEACSKAERKPFVENFEQEAWIKQIINGRDAVILTKRPITPSKQEENLNCRSRSSKLRVIQKI